MSRDSRAIFLMQPALRSGDPARGTGPARDALDYREQAPPPGMADALLTWSLSSRRPLAQAFGYHIVPDGCVDLVFDLRGAGAWLYGASPTPSRAELSGPVDLFGLRLRPGRPGRALGAPGGVLAGRVLDLEDVVPAARTWTDELAAAPERERAGVVARRLAARGGRSAADRLGDRLGEAIADAIVAAGGTVGVDDLARRFSISARHVTRLCRAAAGLSPKQLARLIRFQAALRALAASPATSLAALAADHGYYDQAHLTGEFRALLGATPAAAARAARGPESPRPARGGFGIEPA